MYHSLIISGKNTWDEWKVIPSPRPYVEMPEPVRETVDIPGRYGPLDLSEALTGHIMYTNRTGSWDFLVMNDYTGYNWVTVRDSLASYIHGKKHTIILEDDPQWQYEGRLTFDYQPDDNWSKVSIGYDLGPFKHPISLPASYQNIAVNGSKTVTVTGYDEWAVPTFVVSGTNGATGLYLSVNDSQHFIKEGTSVVPNLAIGPGAHSLIFYGSGTVTIDYRGGRI